MDDNESRQNTTGNHRADNTIQNIKYETSSHGYIHHDGKDIQKHYDKTSLKLTLNRRYERRSTVARPVISL